MDDIKVSVLVYVLNDKVHIEKCVRSVMQQTLKELEILLIDGGSTDGTLEKLEQLQKEDSRIKIIRSGAGVGLQFNTGCKAAAGKYIGICESDDYLLPDMYERQYAVAEQFELDVLRANINRFCGDGDRQYDFPFAVSADRTLYDTLLYPQEDARFLGLGVNCFWSGLYRKEFLLAKDISMNETKGASYQDTSFSFLTQMYAERAYVMSDAFYCYRIDNPNSSVNNPQKAALLNTEYRLLKEKLKQRNLWEKYREIYWKWRVNGYFWAYDNVSEEGKAEYLPVFYKDIREEMESELYLGTEISGKERALCESGRGSLAEFGDFLERADALRKQEEKKIREIGTDGQTVIFGAGNLGLLASGYLEQKGKRAAAYIDNSAWKWDSLFYGLPVLSPEVGVCQYPDAAYIIANAAHGQEMKEQLNSLGIRDDKVVICDNYDLFIAHILVPYWKKGGSND
ncbi:MAG: glycosyltransferase [Lachnospiraceae bacterium]|nr:glycosyltransferase [Lachnospiraceae bacterium]